MLYIFDLEGTLTQFNHRAELLRLARRAGDKQSKAMHYKSWNLALIYDDPRNNILDFYKSIPMKDRIILTAKEEKYRHLVEYWLSENGLVGESIIMKADSNTRTSPDFKYEVVKEMARNRHSSELFFVDDRPDVIMAIKELGVTCLEVV